MSYFDYCNGKLPPATCRRCGWIGEAGGECDCEAMDREQAENDEPPEGKGCFAIHYGERNQ